MLVHTFGGIPVIYKNYHTAVGEVAQKAVEGFEFVGRGAVDPHEFYVGLNGFVIAGIIESLKVLQP